MPQRTCWKSGFPVKWTNSRTLGSGADQYLVSGCHCGEYAMIHRVTDVSDHFSYALDVGGGAVKNDTRNALARIPLRWMVRQCFLANTGIMFNGQLLAQIGLDPGTLYPRVLSRPDPVTFERTDRSRIASDHSSGMVTIVDKKMILTEEEEDLADILSPINDELARSKGWWFLEILPMKQLHQKKDGSWVWRTRCDCLHHIIRSFRTSSFTPLLFSGPIFPKADISHAAITTRSEPTERLSFVWTLKKHYFPRAVDTRLKPCLGNITAWNGSIERFRAKSVPSVVAILPPYSM